MAIRPTNQTRDLLEQGKAKRGPSQVARPDPCLISAFYKPVLGLARHSGSKFKPTTDLGFFGSGCPCSRLHDVPHHPPHRVHVSCPSQRRPDIRRRHHTGVSSPNTALAIPTTHRWGFRSISHMRPVKVARGHRSSFVLHWNWNSTFGRKISKKEVLDKKNPIHALELYVFFA
jgi:hypothetical protein